MSRAGPSDGRPHLDLAHLQTKYAAAAEARELLAERSNTLCWLCCDFESYDAVQVGGRALCQLCLLEVCRDAILPLSTAEFKRYEDFVVNSISKHDPVEEERLASPQISPRAGGGSESPRGLGHALEEASSSWMCSACTLENHIKSEKCNGCGLEKVVIACSKCGQNIDENTPICAVENILHEIWNCGQCNKASDLTENDCRHCGHPREWFCKKCTLANPFNSDECAACGSSEKIRTVKSFFKREMLQGLGLCPSEANREKDKANSAVENKNRLRARIQAMPELDQKEIADDGNCQFRAIAHELFRNGSLHSFIRWAAVHWVRTHAEEYSNYIGSEDDLDVFLHDMSQPKGWGDEITLKAVSEAFKVSVHVITSSTSRWHLQYHGVPGGGEGANQVPRRKAFISYAEPVHYNCVQAHGIEDPTPNLFSNVDLEELLNEGGPVVYSSRAGGRVVRPTSPSPSPIQPHSVPPKPAIGSIQTSTTTTSTSFRTGIPERVKPSPPEGSLKAKSDPYIAHPPGAGVGLHSASLSSASDTSLRYTTGGSQPRAESGAPNAPMTRPTPTAVDTTNPRARPIVPPTLQNKPSPQPQQNRPHYLDRVSAPPPPQKEPLEPPRRAPSLATAPAPVVSRTAQHRPMEYTSASTPPMTPIGAEEMKTLSGPVVGILKMKGQPTYFSKPNGQGALTVTHSPNEACTFYVHTLNGGRGHFALQTVSTGKCVVDPSVANSSIPVALAFPGQGERLQNKCWMMMRAPGLVSFVNSGAYLATIGDMLYTSNEAPSLFELVVLHSGRKVAFCTACMQWFDRREPTDRCGARREPHTSTAESHPLALVSL